MHLTLPSLISKAKIYAQNFSFHFSLEQPIQEQLTLAEAQMKALRITQKGLKQKLKRRKSAIQSAQHALAQAQMNLEVLLVQIKQNDSERVALLPKLLAEKKNKKGRNQRSSSAYFKDKGHAPSSTSIIGPPARPQNQDQRVNDQVRQQSFKLFCSLCEKEHWVRVPQNWCLGQSTTKLKAKN